MKSHNDIVEPPIELDGAKVLTWAWSGHKPFGFVGNRDDPERQMVYGLAICCYDDAGGICRFSCDRNWEVVQDAFYDTVKQLWNNYLPNTDILRK